MNIHPFTLQAGLRRLAEQRKAKGWSEVTDDEKNDAEMARTALASLNEIDQCIEALCLRYIWPDELGDSRIGIVMETIGQPPTFIFLSRPV